MVPRQLSEVQRPWTQTSLGPQIAFPQLVAKQPPSKQERLAAQSLSPWQGAAADPPLPPAEAGACDEQAANKRGSAAMWPNRLTARDQYLMIFWVTT